ncbi:MAG: tetratricopeptide repeat protein [Clostridiales Family XIII bacterium]|nr:tetratricopeptide repeat protein [Clostridiales Family XIII bacterium]
METALFILAAALIILFLGRKALAARRDPGSSLLRTGRGLERIGRYGDAEEHYRLAEGEFRGKGDAAGQAKALFLRGLILKHRKEYDAAMDLFLQAETLCVRLGDRDSLAHDCMCMGETRGEQGRHADAAACLSRAAGIWRELKRTDNYAYACFKLGSALAKSGSYEEAITAFGQAGKIWRRQLNTESLSQIFIEIAVCKAGMGDRDGAVGDYREAERLLKKLGAMDGVTEMRRRVRELEALGQGGAPPPR